MASRAAKGIFSGLTENFWLKLFSLIVTLALFGLIHGAEDAQRTLNVDVEALLPDNNSDRILLSEVPDRVKIRLRGRRTLLETLAREGVDPLEIDLRDGRKQYLYFDNQMFGLPSSVRVLKITPQHVALRWAPQRSQRFNVVPLLVTSGATGLRVANDPLVIPNTVAVRGPVDALKNLNNVSTETINLEYFDVGEHQVTVNLAPLPEHVRYLAASTRVRVVFSVVRGDIERTLAQVPVLLPDESPLRAEPNLVNVTVRGRDASVYELQPSQVLVYPIILAPKGKGRFVAELDVRLPEGLKVTKTNPSRVQLVQTKH